jgi:hypothetical protein
VQAQAAGADRLELPAAGDDGDLAPGTREPRGDQTSYGARAVDADFHDAILD